MSFTGSHGIQIEGSVTGGGCGIGGFVPPVQSPHAAGLSVCCPLQVHPAAFHASQQAGVGGAGVPHGT